MTLHLYLVLLQSSAPCIFFFFFFFQAEDGIRDTSVTGVQTCALPISAPASHPPTWPGALCVTPREQGTRSRGPATAFHRRRSEERRVGKECRSRWSQDH